MRRIRRTALSLVLLSFVACSGDSGTLSVNIAFAPAVDTSNVAYFLFFVNGRLSPAACQDEGNSCLRPPAECAGEFGVGSSAFSVPLDHSIFPVGGDVVVTGCAVDVDGCPLFEGKTTVENSNGIDGGDLTLDEFSNSLDTACDNFVSTLPLCEPVACPTPLP